MQITDITPKIKLRTEKIRLAAYCRVSSDSTEQLHSFATQIRYYSDYVKKNPDYELVDIYADEGLTGTEMDKRDELNRLLRDCKKGKVERIIVKSMSRFMRNTEECLVTLRMLKSIGVSVYFEEQGIDTNKLNSEMIVTFPGMLAQQESDNVSGNLRWGIKKRMQKGEYLCPCQPYGFTQINKQIVINEVEAVIVRRIYNLYLSGMSEFAIAKLLTQEGVERKKNGCGWQRHTIHYILTNEKYMGDTILQKQYVTETLPHRQKKNRGEKTKYYVENYCPPIVTREVFQAVQNLIQSKGGKQTEKSTFPLSKILRYPDCNSTFRRQELRGKAYWQCVKLATSGGECKSRRVREDMVYDAFINLIYKLKQYRKMIFESLIQRLELLQKKTNIHHERIKIIDKEIADLSAKNLVITRLHTNGILDVVEYTRQTTEICNQITELRIERKKKIDEDENDILLDDLKSLNNLIYEYVPKNKFDSDLFSQIVEKIVVDDNTQLTFCIIGGLKFTEIIREKGRCKMT